jgi:uncharacterized protein YjbI with pentapeptide repeats
MRYASLVLTRADKATFSGADLSYSSFLNAQMMGVRAASAVLDYSLGSFAVWDNADLRGASIRFVTWHEANLLTADIRGANFTRSSLLGSDLSTLPSSGGIFNQTVLPDGSVR